MRADLPALVGLLRDDVLGSVREASGDDLTVYERAFDLIDADPQQLLVTVEERRANEANDSLGDGSAVVDESAAEESPVAVDESSASGIVGTLQLTLIPGLSRAGSTRLQIEAVRIGEPAQGIGLGSAVFTWAHEVGRRAGARLAQLTTDRSRADAHRFYERLGYTASHEGLKLDLGLTST